jgi:hypothetical protein
MPSIFFICEKYSFFNVSLLVGNPGWAVRRPLHHHLHRHHQLLPALTPAQHSLLTHSRGGGQALPTGFYLQQFLFSHPPSIINVLLQSTHAQVGLFKLFLVLLQYLIKEHFYK